MSRAKGERKPEDDDTQQTKPTGGEPEPEAEREYELRRVEECDLETVEAVQVGHVLGLGLRAQDDLWAFSGFEPVGELPSQVQHDYPGIAEGSSGFRAVVSRTEPGDIPRIWVRIRYAPGDGR